MGPNALTSLAASWRNAARRPVVRAHAWSTSLFTDPRSVSSLSSIDTWGDSAAPADTPLPLESRNLGSWPKLPPTRLWLLRARSKLLGAPGLATSASALGAPALSGLLGPAALARLDPGTATLVRPRRGTVIASADAERCRPCVTNVAWTSTGECCGLSVTSAVSTSLCSEDTHSCRVRPLSLPAAVQGDGGTDSTGATGNASTTSGGVVLEADGSGVVQAAAGGGVAAAVLAVRSWGRVGVLSCRGRLATAFTPIALATTGACERSRGVARASGDRRWPGTGTFSLPYTGTLSLPGASTFSLPEADTWPDTGRFSLPRHLVTGRSPSAYLSGLPRFAGAFALISSSLAERARRFSSELSGCRGRDLAVRGARISRVDGAIMSLCTGVPRGARSCVLLVCATTLPGGVIVAAWAARLQPHASQRRL